MSLIIKIPGANFTDATLPKLYRDKIMNAGSKFLFDFLSPYCNANADGNIANGAAFTNLVDGAPGATVTTAGSAIQSLAGKAGLFLDGVSGVNQINLGNSYSLHATNPSFLVILWIKIPAVGFEATDYNHILKLGDSTNDCQFFFDAGLGGVRPRVTVGHGAGSNALTHSVASGFGQGAPLQLALEWSPGTLKGYANGVQFASITGQAGLNTLRDTSASSILMSGDFKGTVYRAYQENLTVSGKTGAEQVLADYNANVGRFV